MNSLVYTALLGMKNAGWLGYKPEEIKIWRIYPSKKQFVFSTVSGIKFLCNDDSKKPLAKQIDNVF